MLWIGSITFTLSSCEDKKDDNKESLFLLRLLTGNTGTSETVPSCKDATFCRTFIATNNGAGYNGNLGGITGADAKCTAAKPADLKGNYKAFIVATGSRAASPALVNWVLYPNKEYRRKDGTTATFTTNAQSIVTANLANGIDSGAQVYFWDGISDAAFATGNICQSWTSANAADTGQAGNTTSLNPNNGAGGAFSVDGWNCNQTQNLLCVEQ